jgi:hypothetical protein
VVGGASGGVLSGGLSAAFGGDFWQGFGSGAFSGAISGGVFGGIAAAESKYDRNVLFGNATKAGKLAFLSDLIDVYNAKSQGLNQISLTDNLGVGINAETSPVINGAEIHDLKVAFGNAASGTKSNIAFKYRGRSLRALESTFLHEMVHVNDYYSGYTNSFYKASGNNVHLTRSMVEFRAYKANIGFGYNRSHYVRSVTDFKQVLNIYDY